jgi:hypothetical protein
MAMWSPSSRVGQVSVSRQLLAAFAALALAAAGFTAKSVAPDRAAAHCPGGLQYNYVTVQRNVAAGNYVNGFQADIEWDNSANCIDDIGLNHSIAILWGNGWVEAGWYIATGLSGPRGFCFQQDLWDTEIWDRWEFSITNVTDEFRLVFTNEWWHCKYAGTTKRSWYRDQVGFTASDDVITAFGENELQHGQIGEKSPDNLLFSDMLYRKTSGIEWYLMNPTVFGQILYPYGAEIPTDAKFKVWTNAH